MALKLATIQKAVGSAFKALGEIVTPATYRRSASVYNPATGKMVVTNTDYAISGVFTGFSQYEIDRVVVNVADRKFIMEKRLLPVVPVIATDTVILSGKQYNIVRTIEDPAQATVTLHLRAP